MVKIDFAFTSERARDYYGNKPPEFATQDSAAVDLRWVPQDMPAQPKVLRDRCEAIPTGIRIGIPRGLCGLVLPRSGLAIAGLQVANSPGLIDADYRGEIFALLRMKVDHSMTIHPGDRIAQLLITYAPLWSFRNVDELQETERGDDGLGSTGVE